MKTLQRFSPLAAPLAVAASVVLVAGNLQAFGPGGVGNGNGTATGNGVTTGAAGFGAAGAPAGFSGGHGGATLTTGGGGHPSAAPSIASSRPSVSFSNTAPRLSTGTYSPGAAARASYPASFQGSRGTTTGSVPANPAYQPAAPRVTNAWSGNATTGHYTGGTASPSRWVYDSSGYNSGRSNGQTLYPGAYGSGLANSNRYTYGNGSGYANGNGYNRDGGRRNRFRIPFLGYYDLPFIYASSYAPYYGDGYGTYNGSYPYDTSGNGLNTDPGASNTATANPNFTSPVPAPNTDANPPQPPQPTPVPEATEGGTIPNNGPDSMVEAVQQELVRRGYFGGKVDAMYGPDTKEALRRFQADHHLATTGLINEATMHALQLD